MTGPISLLTTVPSLIRLSRPEQTHKDREIGNRAGARIRAGETKAGANWYCGGAWGFGAWGLAENQKERHCVLRVRAIKTQCVQAAADTAHKDTF